MKLAFVLPPNQTLPNIPVLDSWCQYHYTGGLMSWYEIEDTVINRSALQAVGIKPMLVHYQADHITMLHNVHKNYDDIRAKCKCGRCLNRHNNHKLYKFFKMD